MDHATLDRSLGIVASLVDDLAISGEQACGIVGNALHECDEFRHLHEIGQKQGFGGYGWMQWTGRRRIAFISWCNRAGLDWESDEANYGFLLYELRGSESRALRRLRQCTDVAESAVCFEKYYERAGVKHHKKRVAYAQELWDAMTAGEH